MLSPSPDEIVASLQRSTAEIFKIIGLIEFLQFTESFQPHWALGFIHPLTETSTTSIQIMFLGSKVRQVLRAEKLTAICEHIF
jgi:hypothetical protein